MRDDFEKWAEENGIISMSAAWAAWQACAARMVPDVDNVIQGDRSALTKFAARLEKIAFKIPAPNVYTPALMQLAAEARSVILLNSMVPSVSIGRIDLSRNDPISLNSSLTYGFLRPFDGMEIFIAAAPSKPDGEGA
jgi:hypothetical protein